MIAMGLEDTLVETNFYAPLILVNVSESFLQDMKQFKMTSRFF